jgi:glycosyltransferase involved in cell wall biosynthesis
MALTTPPRAVAARSPPAALLVRRIGRDAIRRMPRPPVLLVSYSGVLGGAERILLDCATRLDRPALVAVPDGPLAAAARAAGLPVAVLAERTLRLRGGGAAAAHAAALGGLARDLARLSRSHPRPAVLVAWGARAVLAAALLPRGLRPPTLAAHCDLPPAGATGGTLRRATARADAAVALSHAIAGALAPGAAVLHPGVDLDRWRPLPAPPAAPPRALVLGALVGWKRADLALEIAARVPELELELGGTTIPGDDGAFLASLQRRAAAPDLRARVRFLGPLADPRPALGRAHLLLHCADAEPYGLALVEALAAGRPVVAPDAAGPREIVTGDVGRLYRPGDAEAGAAAVHAVLGGAATGEAAHALAEARFGVEASAARLRAAVDALG